MNSISLNGTRQCSSTSHFFKNIFKHLSLSLVKAPPIWRRWLVVIIAGVAISTPLGGVSSPLVADLPYRWPFLHKVAIGGWPWVIVGGFDG
jgi:hypothetical protein